MRKFSDGDIDLLSNEETFDKMEKYYKDPLKMEIIKTIEELSKEEKDELIALMYFGRENDYSTSEDFRSMKKKISYGGEYDADHMISKVPFAKYLRTGLQKLNK